MQKLVVLVGIALIGFAIGQDITAISVSLPSIQRSTGATLPDTLWIYYAYLGVITISLPIFNLFSMKISTRKILIIGGSLYAFGCLVAALSNTMWVLIVARVIQGLGTASLIPGVMTWLNDFYRLYDIKTRLFVLMSTLGVAVGPWIVAVNAGGDMDSIGHISLEMAILGTLLALASRPRQETALNDHVDIWGAMSLFLCLLLGLIALTHGSEWGWFSVKTLGFGFAGVAAGAYFVFDELFDDKPLYDIRLLLQPDILIRALTTFVMGWIVATILVLVPIFAANVMGRLPFIIAMTMALFTFPAFIVFHVLTHIPDLLDTQMRLIVSYMGFLFCAVLLTQIDHQSSMFFIAIALVPAGVSWGVIMKMVTETNVGDVGRGMTSANVLLISLGTLGALLGTAFSVAYYQANEKISALGHISSGKVILPEQFKDASGSIAQRIFDIADIEQLAHQIPYHELHKLTPMLQSADTYAMRAVAWLLVVVVITAFGISYVVGQKLLKK